MTIADKVKEIIMEQTGATPLCVTELAELVEDIGMDEAELYEVKGWIEDQWAIEIDNMAFESWLTVQDVIDTVEKMVGER